MGQAQSTGEEVDVLSEEKGMGSDHDGGRKQKKVGDSFKPVCVLH
jgi:hypothetical protein